MFQLLDAQWYRVLPRNSNLQLLWDVLVPVADDIISKKKEQFDLVFLCKFSTKMRIGKAQNNFSP